MFTQYLIEVLSAVALMLYLFKVILLLQRVWALLLPPLSARQHNIHTHLVDYVVENRKGRGAQCAQNLSSGTFYFCAPSWRWWREINKVITVMEMCVFCDDSWARGRCDHMMHRDWVSGRTWTVTTGQSRRVSFAVSETHLGKNINKIKSCKQCAK